MGGPVQRCRHACQERIRNRFRRDRRPNSASSGGQEFARSIQTLATRCHHRLARTRQARSRGQDPLPRCVDCVLLSLESLGRSTRVSTLCVESAVIDHLLALYPEPGKAYKRTYRASEQKRLDREREKELRKVQKVEKARLKREQRDQDGSAIPHRRKVKSQPIVDESDDSAESSSSSSEDEDESDSD